MTGKRQVAVLLFTEMFLQCCFAQRNSFLDTGPLLKCADFVDNRKIRQDIVFLPRNRTSQGIYSPHSNNQVPFPLSSEGNFVCPSTWWYAEVKQRTLNYKGDNDFTPTTPRHFDSVENGTTDPCKHSYFTASGYFYDAETRIFHKPNGQYCIASVSDDKMVLNVCTFHHGCKKGGDRWTICVPKCCAVDEVLSIPSKKCRSVAALTESTSRWHMNDTVFSDVSPWIPPLYNGTNSSDEPNYYGEKIIQHWPLPPKVTKFVTAAITFKLATLPKHCNAVGSQGAHFKWWLDARGDDNELVGVDAGNRSVRLGTPGASNEPEDGLISPMLYNEELDVWEIQTGIDFCVDGYFAERFREGGNIHTNNRSNYVVVYCVQSNGGSSSLKVQMVWISFILWFVTAKLIHRYG